MAKKTEQKGNSAVIILVIVLSVILSALLIALFMIKTITSSRTSIDPYYRPNYEVKKPIIYIYPEEEMNISITTSNPENFTVTYPKYDKGWEVRALPDGTLIDKNGKSYYALYWEGKSKDIGKVKEDGFVIKGEETAEFLEEKLEILGLNYKEQNEFIMYWLPKLEKNKYNYIRFQTIEEINNNMELFITPKPDTLIRVVMEYKQLDKKINVKEQELNRVSRSGYTVVEWGGREI